MRKNTTKARLAEGGAVVGTFIYTMDEAVVEIAAIAGLDFVIIDTEHVPVDTRTVANLIRVAAYSGATPLVRVRSASDPRIPNLLEAGAQGLVLPNVQSAEEVRNIRDRMLYPPQGSRGSCTVSAASEYGRWTSDFGAYMSNADDNLLLVALIETTAGIANVAEIARAGADVVLPGRADLASDMGFGGSVNHPAVLEAVEGMWSSLDDDPIIKGAVVYDSGSIASAAAQGFRFFVHSTDQHVLMAGFRSAADNLRKAGAATVS